MTHTKFVLRKDVDVKEYDPMKNLLNPDKMEAAIVQCLMENDTKGVLEVFENYLYALQKTIKHDPWDRHDIHDK